MINVKGNYHGVEWASRFSFAAAEARAGTYTVDVPKGLTDATLYLGMIRSLPSGSASTRNHQSSSARPIVSAGLTPNRLDIQLRPRRPTTIRVVVSDPPPGAIEVTARYLRENEMKAAGVIFDPVPPLSPDADRKFSLWVLQGAELEISATAANGARHPPASPCPMAKPENCPCDSTANSSDGRPTRRSVGTN